MDLVFDITNAEHYAPELKSSHTFKKAGGLIGRSDSADWSLPDQKRQISNKHAEISFEDGAYYLTDRSTNGTKLNGNQTPLTKDQPHKIEHGDEFNIGEYQISARLLQDPSSMLPTQNDNLIPDDSFLDPEPIDSLFDEEDALISQMVSTDNHTEEQKINSILKDPVPSPTLYEPELNTGQNPVQEIPGAQEQAEVKVENWPDMDADHGILEALSKGLGVDLTKIEGDKQQLAEQVGRLLVQSLSGLQLLLAHRTEMKTQLKGGATMMKGEGNNPLKFSHDGSEALHLMLSKRPGYLNAEEAIRRACGDVQAHQLALMDASQATLDSLLEHLSPKSLSYRFMKQGIRARMGAPDAKYWRAFSRLHNDLMQDSNWRDALIDKDFAQHYEAQLQLMTAALRT